MELSVKDSAGSEAQKFINKLRRFIICNFRIEELSFHLKRRRGGCLQCGRCCKLVYRCPFLIERGDSMKCLVYHNRRPKQCRIFPLDRIDLADVNFRCGYFFDYSPLSDWEIEIKEKTRSV